MGQVWHGTCISTALPQYILHTGIIKVFVKKPAISHICIDYHTGYGSDKYTYFITIVKLQMNISYIQCGGLDICDSAENSEEK